jgi:small nuclear ribonucleoprotein (snRNP)-like protein
VHSNLINKTRNITVEVHLRSGGTIAGRILEVDEVFIEMQVRLAKDGRPTAAKADYDSETPGAKVDRVLVNIDDISYIA